MNSPGTSDGGQDFELNLASIIDCLTVIIAFLLLSSSFVSYGTLDTAVAAPQSSSSSTPDAARPQQLSLSVVLRDAENVVLEVSGSRSEKRAIARSGLTAALEAWKQKYPGIEGVVLTAAPQVEYREVIRGMDDARVIFPAVALGLRGGSR